MSSILDSLKKLEKETLQQQSLPTQAARDDNVRVPKRVLGIVVGVFLFVAIAGLTAFFTVRPGKSSVPPIAKQTPAIETASESVEQNQPPAAVHSSPEQPLSTLEREKETGPANDQEAVIPAGRSADKPMPPENKVPAREAAIESETATASEPPQEDDLQKAVAIQEPESALEHVQPEKPGPSDQPAEIAPAPQTEPVENITPLEERPESIDRLEGVGFKIQAISWSETPGQSLAVINSQILREGDGIEGYQISRINPDDIVLERDGRAYLLEFRSTGAP